MTHKGKNFGGKISERITLYRGLGLPEAAIEVYREYKKKGDDFIAKHGKWHNSTRD